MFVRVCKLTVDRLEMVGETRYCRSRHPGHTLGRPLLAGESPQSLDLLQTWIRCYPCQKIPTATNGLAAQQPGRHLESLARALDNTALKTPDLLEMNRNPRGVCGELEQGNFYCPVVCSLLVSLLRSLYDSDGSNFWGTSPRTLRIRTNTEGRANGTKHQKKNNPIATNNKSGGGVVLTRCLCVREHISGKMYISNLSCFFIL